MLLLFLFVLTVITICVFLVWPMLDVSSPNPLRRQTPAVRVQTDAPAVRPESLEGVLVAQLMAGEITRGQYQRAVEGLAARDEDRHPWP